MEFGTPPNLSNRKLISVTFKNANLQNANVLNTHFQDVEFICCNLAGVDFDKARRKGYKISCP